MINTYGLQYISQSKRYTIWILYNLTTFCANLGFPFSSSFFLQLSWKTVFGENWHRFLMDDALCISQPYTKALKETIQNGNEAFQELWGFPAPCSRQITISTPHHSIFTGWMLFLMHGKQCQSTEYNVHVIKRKTETKNDTTQKRQEETNRRQNVEPFYVAIHQVCLTRYLPTPRPADDHTNECCSTVPQTPSGGSNTHRHTP